MKSSPSVSSSDLERARAIAERLVSNTPGVAAAPVEKPAEYVSFKARGVATAPPPSRPTAPAPPPPPAPRTASTLRPPAPPPAPPSRPEPPPFAAEGAQAEEPPARPVAPPMPPPAPPRAVTPPRPLAPPPPPPPPPPPAGPASESVFEMDDGAGLPQEEESVGVLEDDEAQSPGLEASEPEAPVLETAPAEPSLEFDEDIGDVAAAAVGAASEPAADAPPAPTWAEILDDAIYLAHARCALVMDGVGQVYESRGDWPKNTLDKVAARLLRGIEQAPASPNPDATQLIEIQLGSFFLTGLRAVLQGSSVVVGFLSQAPVKREARPGLEAEIKRGMPLA